MRLPPLLLLSFCLAGCDPPSLAFAGATAVGVAVEGSDFTVRWRGERAAIRTSREFRPSRSGTEAKARRAITNATGCRVKEIDGEASIQLAMLDY